MSSSKTPKAGGKQRSLLSFFTPKTAAGPSPSAAAPKPPDRTPVPSSDPVAPPSPVEETPTVSRIRENLQNSALASSPVRANRTAKPNYLESSDEEDDIPVRGSKRRRRPPVEEDDEDEYAEDDKDDAASDASDFVVPDGFFSDDDEPASKKRKQTATKAQPVKAAATPSTARFAYSSKSGSTTPAASRKTPSKPAGASAKPTPKTKPSKSEQRYSWLAGVRDADGNTPNHPDYDPRTLYIPKSAWNDFSPFEKQYWEIKSKLYDTVVFFKKGKFYELYEDDATIGHQQFDLKLTDRVNMRMVGVPESSLEMWASQFIAKGYKIARVDQSETALGKEMREKGAKVGKEDKIIRRELSCVLTGGTLVDEAMLQDEMSTYCVSIKEDTEGQTPRFGITFVDAATGAFQLTEFVDDADLTKFETFVAQIRPRELVLEKGNISSKAIRILKNNTYLTTIWNRLKPDIEFWDAGTTLRELESQNYFGDEGFPEALEKVKNNDVLMSSFGALICYLQSLKIDSELLSLRNISVYDPVRKATSLVLDGKTLINLEIFTNTYDGSTAGTLFALLNRCVTPFGKRMLKQWICHPLVDATKINRRLDAVEAIMHDDSFREVFVQHLSKLPDLERMISRVHAGTVKAYDFLRVLEGFERIQLAFEDVLKRGEGEGLIGQILGQVPDLASLLKPWETAYDREKVRSEGVLVPKLGVEEDFDHSQATIEGIIEELQNTLAGYRDDLKCRELKFADIGKEIYLIEVPVKVAKSVPKDWSQMSATQKVKRFYSPAVRKLVRSLQEAQETHNQIVKEVACRFYARFDEHYTEWLKTVQIVAHLDCLVGLAKASAALGSNSCRPVFVEDERTVVDFRELRHPCMTESVDDFIPNDIQLGGALPNITLLTGANAAGKSTVLRMTCIGIIMAQVGCYVPCVSARLTPIDRIMSRLGANDNIFAAQSTFFVELSETKKILAESTPRSLVILDELGRGTSSYDGVAVAQSVLHHIATHIGCVGYFATHYHSLAAEFAGHPEVLPRRMKIHVDNENRNITFLYKLEEGVAEGSFGMHCAAMCGINDKIIDRAEEAAKKFEHTSKLKDSLEAARAEAYIPLGLQSDVAYCLSGEGNGITQGAMDTLLAAIEAL